VPPCSLTPTTSVQERAESGRAAYTLVNDSTWMEPVAAEVRRFAERHGLHYLAVESMGSATLAAVVRGPRLWDCQKPESGSWARGW